METQLFIARARHLLVFVIEECLGARGSCFYLRIDLFKSLLVLESLSRCAIVVGVGPRTKRKAPHSATNEASEFAIEMEPLVGVSAVGVIARL